jgi:hypothetical protein
MLTRRLQAIVVALLASCSVFTAATATSGTSKRAGQVLHVPGDYPTIQAAVDAAAGGDTVQVQAGIYNENVVVSTSDVKVHGSAGVVVDGTGLSGIGIHVRGTSGAPVTGVEVSQFEVRNFERGITLELATEARVTHNYVHDNVDKATPASFGDGFGIELFVATASDVSHNLISSNGFGGVRVGGVASTGNTIHHNRVVENGTHACQVCRNAVGIFLTGPANDNQVIFNEIVAHNGRGVAISLPGAVVPITGVLVAHNRIHDNQRAGVFISGAATGNTVEFNDALENNVASTVGPERRCNLFDNSVGSNGGNIFSNNHGTYSGTDACAVPLATVANN